MKIKLSGRIPLADENAGGYVSAPIDLTLEIDSESILDLIQAVDDKVRGLEEARQK